MHPDLLAPRRVLLQYDTALRNAATLPEALVQTWVYPGATAIDLMAGAARG